MRRKHALGARHSDSERPAQCLTDFYSRGGQLTDYRNDGDEAKEEDRLTDREGLWFGRQSPGGREGGREEARLDGLRTMDRRWKRRRRGRPFSRSWPWPPLLSHTVVIIVEVHKAENRPQGELSLE